MKEKQTHGGVRGVDRWDEELENNHSVNWILLLKTNIPGAEIWCFTFAAQAYLDTVLIGFVQDLFNVYVGPIKQRGFMNQLPLKSWKFF